MTRPSRNAPCPCGSGKKFKQCCEAKFAEEAAARYGKVQRDHARSRLVEFAEGEAFAPLRRRAFTEFFEKHLEVVTDEDRREILESPIVQANLENYLLLGCGDEEGRTLLDRFLEERGSRLDPPERRYLEDLRRTSIGFYEVEEAVPGEGLRLRDLWSGESIWIRERSGSRTIVKWDLFAARLATWGNGETVIDGELFVFPNDAREALLAVVAACRRRLESRKRRPALCDFLRGIGALVNAMWLETTWLRPPPDLRTMEGDELVFVKTYFEILDREAVVRALDGHPELRKEEEGEWVWRQDLSETTFRRLGTVRIDRDRLVLETKSRERDARARALLEGAVGEAIRRGTTREDDLDEILAAPPSRERGRGREPEPEVPPEVRAEIERRFRDEHFRKWPDVPVPALGGRTPRAAARSKKGRAQLVGLLKSFENAEARGALEGAEPYDFGWLWEELGLERPGRESS